MKSSLVVFVLFIVGISFAQPYAGSDVPPQTLAKSAGCSPPTTTTTMELNNVRMMVHTAGNLWQVPNQNYCQYEVPKNSGIMCLFTSALWLGGVDVNDQLKLAALRYRNGQDYWTGPLTQGAAEVNSFTCEAYDKHYITLQDDIRQFDAWYSAGEYDAQNGTNTQAENFPNYEVPLIIKEWPAHGDVAAGQDYYLAPFFDRNEDGHYNWQDGDYPWHDFNKTKECTIDRTVSLYGDLNYWWIMNDKGNIHTETGAEPIGMEIRAQAFAFASNDAINNMTFYNYELINRGTQTLYDTYFGFFTDGALGDPQDDYVGCDVNRGLAYYYNGDNYDGDNSGFLGYGYNPPAVGVDFFEGPYQDNDGIDNAFGIGPGEALNGIGFGDGIIDNERFGMRRFLYYSNTTNGADPSQTDPIAAPDYYNYLRGFWKDGSQFHYGGSGHLSDPNCDPNTPADFMFPGDTDPLGWGTDGIPQAPWTEQTAGNPPNDRRFVQSAGPFVLTPGAVNNITVGVVWARAQGGDPFASVETLIKADDKAQALFENCFRVLDGPPAPDLSIQELENELILTLSNPSGSTNANEDYQEFDPFIVADSTADKYYRFQGYQIFQLADNDVALSDLEDPTKARLVAQCDIKDGISRIINFEFEESLGASIPVEKVDGADEGIKHSFRITEDKFAQGDKQLVNFKRYYYMAISYAYNNYKDYDPNDPLLLDGQQKPYIASRKAAVGEVKVMEGIPHNPMSEADGTGQNIGYGSTPRIVRIDGHGNGGRVLEFTSQTLDQVITTGKVDNPVYDYGKGPINVKVIDPLNVAKGYFQLKFRDYSSGPTLGAYGVNIDTASWILYRYESEGGALIDSISSDFTISNDNEQLIPEWGISVHIHQKHYYTPETIVGLPTYYTDFLESSMKFADSSKPWLSFIQDDNGFFPTNWIRSGDYFPDTDPNSANYECLDNSLPEYRDYLDPCFYPDQIGADPLRKWDNILGGGVAPHRVAGYEASYQPMAYHNYPSVTTAKKRSEISYLPSVDIVITSDKSKWTRCPVIETGRDPQLNIGGAEPGAMRKSPSVDKNGNPLNDGTTGMGWFPGYAIDLESGVRLYMAFGENSFLTSDNGADMIWNPSERIVDNGGVPVMGGVQPVYIFNYNVKTINNYALQYDYKPYYPWEGEVIATNQAYQDMLLIEGGDNTMKRNFYSSLSWVINPRLTPGQEHLSSDVKIRLRVSKEYADYVATGINNGQPMYSWSMDDVGTDIKSEDHLAEAIDLINVVPNPYNAYSEYERNRLDSRIKITNLPERCTIAIYDSRGKLVQQIKKDNPQTYQDWNLTNHAGVPIASGVYLIHVEVRNESGAVIGHKIVKSFIAMRQTDLQNI